jgi:transcriptional regulator with XRE-family HTH domain
MNFGEFFRNKRLELGMTLRAFCEKYNLDPGNISKLERNILSPSLDNDTLVGYASALKIKRNSEEWVLFHDLAHTAKGQIPQDVLDNPQSDRILPLFFQTARGKKLTKKQLKELTDLLNES